MDCQSKICRGLNIKRRFLDVRTQFQTFLPLGPTIFVIVTEKDPLENRSVRDSETVKYQLDKVIK